MICDELDSPDNGTVVFSDLSRALGTIATYSCNEGFRLNGSETRECGGDGEWTEEAPTCDRTLNV